MKRFGIHNAVLIWMLILGVFILPGCGGDVGNGHWDKPGTTTNPAAPTVTAVVPLANATAVPINTKIITAAFSKAMEPTTLTVTSFTLACNGTPITGGGAVTYLAAGNLATLPLPAATNLPPLADCTATLTTVATAQDGNALASDYVWIFTTGATADTTRPRVLRTVPATTTPGPTVAVSNTAIRAIFTENMAPASITAPGTMTVTAGPGLTPVDGALIPVTYAVSSRTATFIPLNPLTVGVTYTVTIKGTGTTPATDTTNDVTNNALAGNQALPPNASDYIWSFTPTAGPVAPAPLSLLTFGIASAGGISNIGATKVNGNVVLDPTATCNLQPILFTDGPGFGLCGGNIINIPLVNAGDQVITPLYPDTTTAHAVMDELTALWISIKPSDLPGGTVLGCGTIGNAGDAGALIGCDLNATLPPGVYISATGSTIGIAGALTLDGGGNPNAEWYFQSPSALNVEVGSQIILTNGAKASNIWWFVGSSATLKTNSIFQGNILASASISMQQGATSCGRLLAGAEGSGEFSFLGNTVSVPGHPNAPLGCE